ncbi:MAG: hypothetical protein DRQ61_00130 [Gammaproteobacteria bacterium]|nr:MAG: hypothetical protein DRQ61_00130 [Gammaproteobacteria bacterium]
MKIVSADSFHFKDYLRAGDHIICGQCTAEPLTLTQKLVAEREEISGCTLFLGALYSDTFKAEQSDHLSFYSYGGIGQAAALAKAGVLDQLPQQYSAFSQAFYDGSLRADCVLLQLSQHPESGQLNLGLCNDYTALAARRARVVIAEINTDVPYSYGADLPADINIDLFVEARHPPVELSTPQLSAVEWQIGQLASTLIPDRSTIQVGVGGIPHAVLGNLKNHCDIGIHSGVVIDAMLDLIEQGVITIAPIEAKFCKELLTRIGFDPATFPDLDDRNNWPHAKQLFATRFVEKTADEWCALLEGTDACFAPVLNMAEAADHPHNQHRGTFITVDGITQPAPSPRFSRTKTAQPTPPEAAGNSTYQVLSHWGFSDNKIKNLEAAGAIGKTKK